MRAEAQTHIDQINSATALLRRFLDWDRALKRLQELNDKVEDPALWNDPKAAQDVMRERRRLEEAIKATQAIESELADTAELIEMAESEGDDVPGLDQVGERQPGEDEGEHHHGRLGRQEERPPRDAVGDHAAVQHEEP